MIKQSESTASSTGTGMASDENETHEPLTDLRYSLCKDWVEKQNSEGAKKLSQQNKNDIQFIIQTNAGRQKFMLSADEDEASVPVGVGEPAMEPKAVKLHKLRIDNVPMECGWQSCNQQIFQDYTEFQTHCRNHISDLQVTEEDGKIVYTCLWDSCKHKNSDFDEIWRHMNYHAYHARLLGIGFNAQATLNLTSCNKDSSGRNKLPLLASDFCCLWVGCDVKFKIIQSFLDHVKSHIYYATSRYTCSWAGCGASFPRKELLTTHVRFHTGERLLACYHCGTHFACNRKLNDHRRRQNVPSGSEHKCSICGDAFATDYLCNQHYRQHISYVACTLCDMSAPNLGVLAQHIRYRHMGDQCRTYACEHCDHKSVTKSDLRKHVQTHLRKRKRKSKEIDSDFDDDDEDDDDEPAKKKKKEKKKYACHLCPKVFSRGTRVTTHLDIVHGVKWPFGHCRFRYQISKDGMYRLTTTRLEVIEVSEKIVDGGPKDSLSNTFEFNLERKSEATLTTPTCFEITLKDDEKSEKPKNAVEITMCDVDEEGNIISSEVIKSDVVYPKKEPVK